MILYRIARVCSLPLYILCFGTEYIFVSRLKQYHRCVVTKHTNRCKLLHCGVLDDLGNVHVYRWWVRLFGLSTTRVLMYSRFFIMRVWRCMKFLSFNGAGHLTRSFFYSVRAQEINNARGMHSDQHRSLLLLTFLPVHSISSEFWLAFCSLYRITSTNTFTAFGTGT